MVACTTTLLGSGYSLLSARKARFGLLVVAGAQVILASNSTPRYLTVGDQEML